MSRNLRIARRRTLWAVLLILGLMLPALAFAQTPPAAPEILLKLPRDLSPWGMFMAADIVVKAVEKFREKLREKAKKQLGNKFDIRQFHAVVLTNGAVPLDLLEELVDRWIKTKSGA